MALCCCCRCCKKPQTPAGWLCCGILSIAGCLWFIALGVWAFMFHSSLSPVYTDVNCKLGKMDIQKMSWTGGLTVDLVSQTICENPNPYAVELRSSEGVNVYFGNKRTLVSHINDIEPTVLPARGMGTINVHVQSKPTAAMFGTIFGALFTGTTPVWIENSIDLKIEINFYFMKLKLGTKFTKDCAMNVKLLRGSMAKLGPLTCGEDFDELEIPPVIDEPFKGQLPLYDYHLADSEIKMGTMAKDIGLGLAMVSGFGLGTVLFFWSFFCVIQFCQGRGAKSGNDEATPRRSAREVRTKDRERSRSRSRDRKEQARREIEEAKKMKEEARIEQEVAKRMKEEARKEKKEAAKEKKKSRKSSKEAADNDIEEGSQKQEV